MRESYSIFDITGPIIIGPSSSHTAGACRLANAARSILGQEVDEAIIHVYGSFAETLYGHGTDKALVGGLLAIPQDDESLVDAFEYAAKRGLKFQFVIEDETMSNANMVLFELTGKDGAKMNVRGASIGGGSIMIDQIDETSLQISLKYNTLVVDHLDKPGAVLNVSRVLAEHRINIASMNLYRQGKHGRAYMILETDQEIGQDALQTIDDLDDMKTIYIKKMY
jgi:L-serine dehydratase